MPERPYSRYTREKTWAALYSQHINAGYALVPFSTTSNSIDVIRCPSPEDAQKLQHLLDEHAEEYKTFYEHEVPLNDLPSQVKEVNEKKRSAVVLARSSDYYHYSLSDIAQLRVVICGLHNSYLHLPVWETRTNRRYRPKETAVAISSPDFDQIRRTQFGHSILVGALYKGDEAALSFMDGLKKRSERSYWRIKAEVETLQDSHYRGRPLAFLTEAERRAIGSKISASLKLYHEKKRLHLV
ncbi:hypothetical protein [Dictyobacter formicarum]|uniref:Uncharacterized protein n=1 Tax=Dictyobacter formicarum TaxID=2778368 RepID=A0ABQ3VA23_9CHLR|nr:hypothetical protein [Dictyobacter formicarum]GHO82992.1 hypothetical protein KSZ_09980 [Dictyobacter formicarum]